MSIYLSNAEDRIKNCRKSESVVMLYTPTKEKDSSVYQSIENEEVDIESFPCKKRVIPGVTVTGYCSDCHNRLRVKAPEYDERIRFSTFS